MAETLFRGSNVPVALNSITVVRAQDFQVTQVKTLEEVYQLGNKQAVGLDESQQQNTGRLVYLPISAEVENALVGVSSETQAVKLSDIMGMSAATLQGAANTKGLTGAKLVSLEYTAAINGRWQATMNLRGTAFDPDGATVTPDTPSGVAAYRTKHIMVQFSGFSSILERIRSLNLRINLTLDEAYEFHNADPFDVEMDVPQIILRVEWYANYESGTEGAHSYRPLPTTTSLQDCIIQVGTGAWDATGNIKYTLKNLAYQRQDFITRVRQRAFYTIEYRSSGDNATYGFQVEKIV